MIHVRASRAAALWAALAFLISGCGGLENDLDTGAVDTGAVESAAVADPGQPGPFTQCTYTPPANAGYSAALVYYPCQVTQGPFAATTLTGGFTNTFNNVSWIARHLVTHGYVVYAMTPVNNRGLNIQWTNAHKAGIAMLASENARAASPIFRRVDTTKLQVFGYSKGGGGALLAAADLGTRIKATQAMAPFMDSSFNLSRVASATIVYTGTRDTIASPSRVVQMYNALPTTVQRTLAYFNGFPHGTWANGGNLTEQGRAKVYITSWMKVFLNGDTGYQTYLSGDQHAAHLAANWFFAYSQNARF